MAEHEIKLSGWQAILALVVVVGILGVRLATFNDQKDNTALMEKLKLQLTTEYYPNESERLRAALNTGDDDAVKSVVSTKLNIQSVQTSYPLFSFASNKDVIVKVTYSLDDKDGTHKTDTQYYRYRYGAIGDSWSYEMDSNALSYYLNFM